MSCEHLICAQCAGPVVEGRCPVCRASREKLHDHGIWGISPAVILLFLIVLFFFTLTLKHLTGN
jgi:hypothetical protein